jgi:hypothetical protein
MENIFLLQKQYGLLTKWFCNVLDEINDADGSVRFHDRTNNIRWLAGHLVAGRYRNLARLGVHAEEYPPMDKYVLKNTPPPNAIAFDPAVDYPSLAESLAYWKQYSEQFMQALKNVTKEQWSETIPFTVPIGGNTIGDALTFIAMHETYHIGQMSLMRKSLGYPAMVLV